MCKCQRSFLGANWNIYQMLCRFFLLFLFQMMQHIIVLEIPSNNTSKRPCEGFLVFFLLKCPSFHRGFFVGGFVRSLCVFFHCSSSRSCFHCFTDYTIIYTYLLIYVWNEALPFAIGILHIFKIPSHRAVASCSAFLP